MDLLSEEALWGARGSPPFAGVERTFPRKKLCRNAVARSGQNGVVGRPRRLDDALTAQLVADVELGTAIETAARSAGVSARSVRRWREQGQREVASLVQRLGSCSRSPTPRAGRVRSRGSTSLSGSSRQHPNAGRYPTESSRLATACVDRRTPRIDAMSERSRCTSAGATKSSSACSIEPTHARHARCSSARRRRCASCDCRDCSLAETASGSCGSASPSDDV